MCDDSALKLLEQISVNTSRQQNGYPTSVILRVRLENDAAVVEISAARPARYDTPNVQYSAVGFHSLRQIANHSPLLRQSAIARLDF